MKLVEALQEHLALCEELHLLYLEENRVLQSTQQVPGEHLLAWKRELLPRLNSALLAVSMGRKNHPNDIPRHAEIIERLQKKMLSLLLLDRENEKLLLKYSGLTAAPRVAAKPRAHVVSRAYSSAGA